MMINKFQSSLTTSSSTSTSTTFTMSMHDQMLESNRDDVKLEAMRCITVMTAKGKLSVPRSLFPHIVKNVSSKNPELRKLIYLYLTNFADQEPDLALLPVATLQKSLKSPNPLVRSSALKVLTSMRLHILSGVFMATVGNSVNDLSPYVRKTVAHSIIKIYRLDPETKEDLIGYLERSLNDKNSMVISSAVAAFETVCPDNYSLINKHYRRFCFLLADCNEWGQTLLLKLMTRYILKQAQANELEVDPKVLLRAAKPLVHSNNSAVVMAVVRLYIAVANQNEVRSTIPRPLIRLLFSHREIQLIALDLIEKLTKSDLTSEERTGTNDPKHVRDGDQEASQTDKAMDNETQPTKAAHILNKKEVVEVLKELEEFAKSGQCNEEETDDKRLQVDNEAESASEEREDNKDEHEGEGEEDDDNEDDDDDEEELADNEETEEEEDEEKLTEEELEEEELENNNIDESSEEGGDDSTSSPNDDKLDNTSAGGDNNIDSKLIEFNPIKDPNVYKEVFRPYLKSFFVKHTDCTQIKLAKLRILTNLSSPVNVTQILRELQAYVACYVEDKRFVAASIHAIGQCSLIVKEVAHTCLNGLTTLLSNNNEHIVAEAIVVLRSQIMNKSRAVLAQSKSSHQSSSNNNAQHEVEESKEIAHDNNINNNEDEKGEDNNTNIISNNNDRVVNVEKETKAKQQEEDESEEISDEKMISTVIKQVTKLLPKVIAPQARATILWILAEFCQNNRTAAKCAPNVLRSIAKSFCQEDNFVKLQALTLASKFLLTLDKEKRADLYNTIQLLTGYLFSLAKYDTNHDVRDRGRFLKKLLEDEKIGARVLNCVQAN